MQITEEQKRILNSLTCERLSSNPENLRLVEHFYNTKNGSLEHTLKDAAYAEDEENNIAYGFINLHGRKRGGTRHCGCALP